MTDDPEDAPDPDGSSIEHEPAFESQTIPPVPPAEVYVALAALLLIAVAAIGLLLVHL